MNLKVVFVQTALQRSGRLPALVLAVSAAPLLLQQKHLARGDLVVEPEQVPGAPAEVVRMGGEVVRTDGEVVRTGGEALGGEGRGEMSGGPWSGGSARTSP